MLPQQLIKVIHDSWLGEFVRSIYWMFGALETVHFFGLCLLIGAMLLVDLRLMGVIKRGSLREVLQFTHIAIVGFALAFLSGISFFASSPANYNQNPLFWAKMAAVVLAGLNVAWFELVERRKVLDLPDGADPHPDTKLVAGLSLLLWATVIVLGRFLPLLGLG